MILGIVGHERAKFTPHGFHNACRTIRGLIDEYKPVAVSSGHCELGGIDIWSELIAIQKGCYDAQYIFPANGNSWEENFKPRNIQISRASDIVCCLVVDKLPDTYTGRRFKICYHCARYSKDFPPHVKSGGCWTMHHCEKELKKAGRLIVIDNGL